MIVRRLIATLATLCAVAGVSALWSAPAFAAPPETPVAKPATEVTGTTAILNGELNPGTSSEPLIYLFAYSRASECGGEFIAPEEFGTAEGNHKAVSVPLTNLVGNTEYTFCLIAFNATTFEQTQGSPLKFKTLAIKPVVGGERVSAVTPFDGVLEAKVKPENQDTTYHFEYATNEELEGATTVGEGTALAAAEEQAAGPADLGGGLTPGTTYYFRAVATNATGETKGAVEHFTTLPAEAPVVEGESSSGVTSSGATLEAAVNPRYQETTCHFQYVSQASFSETGYGAAVEVPCTPEALGNGSSGVGASVSLTSLQAGTAYHYRVNVTNATGTTEGSDQTFTTLATPAVVTALAQYVTRTTATLTATVNPSGAPTTDHYAYVAAADYEPLAPNPYSRGRTTSEAEVGSDYAVHPAAPTFIGGLQPGVTYHYAVVATNSIGSTIGGDVTFTTSPPTPPVAVTGEATGVGPNSATLTGTVDTRELQTTLRFELGTTPGSGYLVPATVTPGSGSGAAAGISDTLSGSLQPATTYYYRTVATNSDGTSYGAERSFTTGSVAGQAAATPVQLIAWPSFVAAALAAGQPHETTSTGGRKPLTKAQKLVKALKACKRKPKKHRASCRRQAKRRYR